MRQIVLDTETTGLETSDGHRIIEVGCIEMVDRRITGEQFHRYVNPEREIDAGALEVHGLDADFLAGKPLFADIVGEFLEFVRDAQLIIHNAPFDVGFLDYELSLAGPEWGRTEDHCSVLDTLDLARRTHPGMKNSLDALCKRYSVDNTGRTLHGALLDAQLLAEVYLAMTGGQTAISFGTPETRRRAREKAGGEALPDVVVVKAGADELAAHEKRLAAIREQAGHCVWDKLS